MIKFSQFFFPHPLFCLNETQTIGKLFFCASLPELSKMEEKGCILATFVQEIKANLGLSTKCNANLFLHKTLTTT